jgi:hypothetical protein
MNSTAFCGVTKCSPVEVYRGVYRLPHQVRRVTRTSEEYVASVFSLLGLLFDTEGGRMLFQNVGKLVPDDSTLCRKYYTSIRGIPRRYCRFGSRSPQ